MRMIVAVFLAHFTLFLSVDAAHADLKPPFEFPVRNDLPFTCRFWWSGSANGQSGAWKNVEINRRRTKTVSFAGDDPFALVVKTREIERSLGYVKLREYAESNPAKALILSGGYLAEYEAVYNSCRRRFERRRVRAGYVIHADFIFQDGTVLRFSGYGRDMPR